MEYDAFQRQPSTYVGAKRNVDRGQVREPVPSSGRGIQNVVVARVDHAIHIFVEKQPGEVIRAHIMATV